TARDLRIGQKDERRIESQEPFAAGTVGVIVEDPVGAPNHGLRSGTVSESEAWRKVITVRLDQRLILERAALGGDECARRPVEIRPLGFPLPGRRGELVTQSEVQRQLARDFPVVLQKQEVQVLVDFKSGVRILLVPRGKTEQEVGQGV